MSSDSTAVLMAMATEPSKPATVERTASSRSLPEARERLIIEGMTLASVVISAGNLSPPAAIRSEKLSTSPLRAAVT